jgi:hypothetical protein
VYLAAALIVRIRAEAATWRTFALLGAVLALGYLAKAAMFPLAFAFLGVSLFSVGNLRRAMPLTLVALVFFLLIGGPLVAALSTVKGRPTFSDTGNLMYAWYVNDIPYHHWQGEVPGGGTPKHPTRKIFEVPPIYEFGTPIAGTYPVHYDPSYWYEGVDPHFDLKGQIRVLISSAQFYFDLFFRQQGGLLMGILILYGIGRQRGLQLKCILQQWGLAIVALVAFGMYALVHVQSRYIGAFVVLLWADLLAGIRLPNSQESRRCVALVSAGMLLFVLANIAAFNLEGLNTLTVRDKGPGSQEASPPRWPGEVAEELHQLGVRPGDKVAVIGYAFDSYWARLARVKIVAEMLDWQADPFWLGEPSLQSRALQAFANTGAKAVVAERVPAYAHPTHWHRVGNSNYYIRLLAQ